MRIVQLNLAADPTLATPESLLHRYHTLTGWSDALQSAGAHVEVIQRFGSNGDVTRQGVRYRFVRDDKPPLLPAWSVSPPVLETIARLSPDLVHVNGLMFPAMTRAVRDTIGPSRVLVLQDHSGAMPRSWPWPLAPLVRRRLSTAWSMADACSFTAREHAERWQTVGLPGTMGLLVIPEASTSFVAIDRTVARDKTGLSGTPAVLWVGRLDENKDPLTVLAGVERALPRLEQARLWMIVPESSPRDAIERRLAESPRLRDHVSIIGAVPHASMPMYYSAADIFVSGSHHEGSGYALIEAIACGVTPCVTDIPAFRAIAGPCGVRWQPGDSHACAAGLVRAAALVSPHQREMIAQHFERRLGWNVIGRLTLDAYSRLIAGRASRR